MLACVPSMFRKRMQSCLHPPCDESIFLCQFLAATCNALENERELSLYMKELSELESSVFRFVETCRKVSILLVIHDAMTITCLYLIRHVGQLRLTKHVGTMSYARLRSDVHTNVARTVSTKHDVCHVL